MSQERLSTGAFSALGGGNWPGHHPANRCCVGVKATSPASLSFLPGHSWPGQPLHQRPSGSGLPPRLIGRDSLLQRRPQYPGKPPRQTRSGPSAGYTATAPRQYPRRNLLKLRRSLMLTQPLLDKLSQLRLSGFRAALEEQLHNPQYDDLSF